MTEPARPCDVPPVVTRDVPAKVTPSVRNRMNSIGDQVLDDPRITGAAARTCPARWTPWRCASAGGDTDAGVRDRQRHGGRAHGPGVPVAHASPGARVETLSSYGFGLEVDEAAVRLPTTQRPATPSVRTEDPLTSVVSRSVSRAARIPRRAEPPCARFLPDLTSIVSLHRFLSAACHGSLVTISRNERQMMSHREDTSPRVRPRAYGNGAGESRARGLLTETGR